MIQNILSNIDLIPILQIIWIDLILSGDNAIVIALACRGLPEHQKKIGMVFGVATAIILRIFFASIITLILDMPYIRTVGGILLLWIAIKLILPEKESDQPEHGEAKTLWKVILMYLYLQLSLKME